MTLAQIPLDVLAPVFLLGLWVGGFAGMMVFAMLKYVAEAEAPKVKTVIHSPGIRTHTSEDTTKNQRVSQRDLEPVRLPSTEAPTRADAPIERANTIYGLGRSKSMRGKR